MQTGGIARRAHKARFSVLNKPAASNETTNALSRRLEAETEGEVLFDLASRGRYATDASFYQIKPFGVVVPRTMDDALRAMRLKQANLAASNGEANRLIDGGGVRIDSNVVSDKGLKLGAGTYVLQVGKRKFARVTLA